mmetsp:Transcript_36588/g.91625  ORF Transcript_36588/g.91625 Transcript_36588/m.91625 type:complete len:238 (-) Transcript_36588:2953-3666(-)
MVVNVQITRAIEADVKASVLGELLQHVIEEAHTSVDVRLARPTKAHTAGYLGLFGRPRHLPDTHALTVSEAGGTRDVVTVNQRRGAGGGQNVGQQVIVCPGYAHCPGLNQTVSCSYAMRPVLLCFLRSQHPHAHDIDRTRGLLLEVLVCRHCTADVVRCVADHPNPTLDARRHQAQVVQGQKHGSRVGLGGSVLHCHNDGEYPTQPMLAQKILSLGPWSARDDGQQRALRPQAFQYR